MIIYEQEQNDGLADRISASNTIAYASVAEPSTIKSNHNLNTKIAASINDADLYYVQSILVSSSWNRNDDIFDKAEVWAARNTPEDKPTNLEHDENIIIGHITSNWPIDENGQIISSNINVDDLPDKFHILTGSVIYKAYSAPELKNRAEKLIGEIQEGKKYVSMECYFNGFDYGLIDEATGQYKILRRNNDTAYLTKYLRAYGGQGKHENYKIGRVLRNITFSGKGFVDKPANPDSIIFNKELLNDLITHKKNDNLSKSGVLENKPIINEDMENITMNENVETQMAEINSKLDVVSASCADQVNEAKALASELEKTNQTLEAAMKETETTLIQATETIQIMKTEYEEAAKKWSTEKTNMEEELRKTKSELDTLSEVLAAYKKKEEEMIRKEKMMTRKASLVEAGLDDDAASAAVEKFEALDEESFDVIKTLIAAMKPAKKEMVESSDKQNASDDDAEAALEQVETEETLDLSIGNDGTESAEANIRSELVEFVSARLSKTSK
jgi:hypothetical protein